MKDFLLPFALTLSTWPTSHYPLVPYYKSCGFFRLRLKNPVTPTLSYAKVNDSARPPPHLRHLLTFSPWLGLSPAHSPLGVGRPLPFSLKNPQWSGDRTIAYDSDTF